MAIPVPPLPPPPGVGRVNPNGTPTQAQIDYERKLAAWIDASVGSISTSIPFPTLTTIGGVKAATAPTHQFQRGIDTTGNPLFAQPAAGDISGLGPFATASSIAVGSITGLGSLATLSSVNLASQVTGNLGVSHFNSGIDASASTVWHGNGTWGPITASPGGSSGQVQFNSAGSLAGFTLGGDGSLDVTTGLLTVTKTNGVAFATVATSGSASDLLDGNVGTGAIAHAANPSFTGTAMFQTISASTIGATTATLVTAHTTNFDATTATIGTATIGTLTTNTVAGGFANLSNSTNAAQLHLSGTGLDNGGYVLGHATNEIYLGGGASFDGSVWTAKATTSSILGNGNGTLLFWSDTGLTVGSTFAPTLRFNIDATGTIVTGIVPVARVTGLATVATSGSAADLTGTLALARLGSQSANLVLSGPSTGAAANPTFRALVGADLPNPSATTLGGVQSKAAVASNWLTSISTSGVPAASQPAFSDISGTATATQGGTAQSTWTLGDLLYSSAANTLAKLAGNTTSTKKYLSQTGTGTVSAVPAWAQVAAADVSGLAAVATSGSASDLGSGTLPVARLNGLSNISNSIGANVLLTNTALYFDGPSVSQGTSGTWFASGTVTLGDTAGAAIFVVRLWDGTTTIDTTVTQSPSGNYATASVSGVITSPAGNLRISVKDISSASGKMVWNDSGLSKDSTISAFRIG